MTLYWNTILKLNNTYFVLATEYQITQMHRNVIIIQENLHVEMP